MRREAELLMQEERPILPWRLVAAAFLHFIVPFYLVAILLDVLAAKPHAPNAEAVLRQILAISPALLGSYVGFAMLLSGVAALVDPVLQRRRARRNAADPRAAARRSELCVQQAARLGKALFGPRADAALAHLVTAGWDHTDFRQQALSRDLLEAVAASATALSTAWPARRTAIADMAADSLDHIVAAQNELADDRALEDERKVRAIAGYVEARYRPSDFSGGAD
jgi:hypothetical protein